MRPATACHACRLSKRKCRLKRDEVACVRCSDLQITCSLNTSLHRSIQTAQETPLWAPQILPRSHWEAVPSVPEENSSPSSDESHHWGDGVLLTDQMLRREMVLWYFRIIHDKHHSLFHQPTFEKELDAGLVPDVILAAMVALGARFSDASPLNMVDRRFRGDHYAERAHRLLDLRVMSIATIQACILLGTLCFAEGRTDSESLYYAAANRLALLMDLPRRPVSNELERQINLRVWWSLYMIDIWSSTGLHLPRQLDFTDGVAMPSEETHFLRLTYESQGSEPVVNGIWAVMARLARIWAEIQDVNKMSVEGQLEPILLHARVDSLLGKLDRWYTFLPHFVKETTANLQYYASIGFGMSFAALHLGYHYYNEVLLYQFMAENDHNESIPAKAYAERCTQHAMQFCDLLYLCETTEGCECLYVMVGHMLVVTSTVYMHILLFSTQEDQIAIVRKRLAHNFEILTKLQQYWPTLDTTLSRLKVFHNACQNSIEHSFRMDRWMLKFILEHGTSMPEKFCVPINDTPTMVKSTSQDGTNGTFNSLQDWYSQTFS